MSHSKIFRRHFSNEPIAVGEVVKNVPNQHGEKIEEKTMEEIKPYSWIGYNEEVPIV